MIHNYITIALRNIRRNISYTLINITGLSLGITCSLVLFLIIRFQTSFDTYHADGDRIYRFVNSTSNSGREDFFPGVPAPFPDAVASDITGIESVLFISASYSDLITIEENGDKRMFEEQGNVAYTDSVFFRFFNRPLLYGTTSLKAPNEAVVSKKLVKKFFDEENAVGKVIRVDNKTDFVITGVMEDFPDNTSFPMDIFLSYETIKKSKLEEGWENVWSDDQCYVMLEPGKDPEEINRQMPEFVKKYNGEENAQYMKRWIQPLSEINHDSRFSNYRYRTAPQETIWAMGVVAVFLIITASINFINLTTAVAVRRSKEVGIRKVLGSQRMQLVFQYLSETGLITLLALLISAGLSELALIKLNSFLYLNLHVDFQDSELWIFMLLIWIVVSLISGLYPAFLLSGFSPVLALKNKMTNRSSGGFLLRRSLVVFQFVISQFLIVATIILVSQMNYFNSKDLGFTKEAIITVPIPETDIIHKKMSLRDHVRNLPGVQEVSLCSTPPSSGSISVTSYQIDEVEEWHHTQVKLIDSQYLNLFEMELVAGKSFDDIDTANAWIVNEKLVQSLGLQPEEILGRNLRMRGRNLPVSGVVKNFHTVSLTREIDPTTLSKEPGGYYNLAIKLQPGQFNNTIKKIEEAWSALYPDFLFRYEFLDQQIANFYESTQKMSVLLIVFSCIAILIGCLGLYGLISFMANQKEKEIGIRKVHGATVTQVMYIFSKEFTLLILIAFAIAAPLSAFVMSKWLQNFTYSISLQWTMFATGILVTLAIAFVTVAYRSVRAATANPVDALRTE